jgi:glucose-6-phosphate isomerase/transaldolase/glucose-6-phosphate isomerase
VTSFAIHHGSLSDAYVRACARLDELHALDGLWQARLDVWSADPAVQKIVANRLGWLHALEAVDAERSHLAKFVDGVRRDGYARVVLMGMGGSSLAPEVLHQVLGTAPGFPRFVMIDTVDPDAVRECFSTGARTLAIVASKSGGTIEPTVLAAEARRVGSASGDWGRDAAAITDRDTVLHRQALDQSFRDVFINPSDIGGRFSALSLFGMVPAALLGADLDALLGSARAMAEACRRVPARDNPGLALGAFIASAAAAGRDKLTLLLPRRFAAFGLWVEQLVAESTGKSGAGVLPVVGEIAPRTYGADRAFVSVTFCGEGPDAEVEARARASAAPVLHIDVPRAADIAGEFFRWEVATAACGLLLGVNPFDEPNVQQAKDATRALLDAFTSQGRLPMPEPHAVRGGLRLTLSDALSSHSGTDAWPALLASARPGDYVALLAYAPPGDDAFEAGLVEARSRLGEATGLATTAGYGPRYLHSTGQLHKGGPNTGLFIVLTPEPRQDLPIPGHPFSFGTLEAAQALGDFQSLSRTARRAVHVHLAGRDPALLAEAVRGLIGR